MHPNGLGFNTKELTKKEIHNHYSYLSSLPLTCRKIKDLMIVASQVLHKFNIFTLYCFHTLIGGKQ